MPDEKVNPERPESRYRIRQAHLDYIAQESVARLSPLYRRKPNQIVELALEWLTGRIRAGHPIPTLGRAGAPVKGKEPHKTKHFCIDSSLLEFFQGQSMLSDSPLHNASITQIMNYALHLYREALSRRRSTLPSAGDAQGT